MGMHDTRGYRPVRLNERPNGYPAIGDEFEYAWPPRGRHTSGYGNIDVQTFRVVGWEKQIDDAGSERISVLVHPIASRIRNVISMSWQTCNLGHAHEVFEYEDNAPLKGTAPEIWGTSSDE